MLKILTLILIFRFAFACEDEALQWRPENSILLRSLGWNPLNSYDIGAPPIGYSVIPLNEYLELERSYLNGEDILSYYDYMERDSYLINGDEVVLVDVNIGLESIHLIGGDIIPSKNDSKDKPGNSTSIKDKLWPKGVVPYVISSNSSTEIKVIQGAMKYIENVTCIRFIPRTEEENYVIIHKGQGCSSQVGMSGGVQSVILGPSCYKLGIIMHELLHVIGFYHEQSRSDRDQYIDILWENIQIGHEKNFKKTDTDLDPLLTPYDYNSIMQYGEYAFSKNKTLGLKTMTAKKKGVVLLNPGDKVLSQSDIKRIFILYNC